MGIRCRVMNDCWRRSLAEQTEFTLIACSISVMAVWLKGAGRSLKPRTMWVRCCSPPARAWPICGNGLKQLEEEADRLWAPRKSARFYYQAQARLEEAQSRQRGHSLSVSAWRTARKTLSDAEKRLQKHRKEREETSKELKEAGPHPARSWRDTAQAWADAGDQRAGGRERAGRGCGRAARSSRAAGGQDQGAGRHPCYRSWRKPRKALEGITFDEAFVRRAGEIMQLNEQRIAVRGGREDLPKRRDEYRLELESLARLGAEIGWEFGEPSELIERIPPRSRVEAVRRLLARHGELAVELRSARKALDVSQAALQDKTERLDEIGEATDISGLAAVLNAVREIGDMAGRIRTAEGQVAEIAGGIEKKLRSMKPVMPAGTDIEALPVPPRDTIIAHRDDVRKWAQRDGDTKQRLTEARNHLERDQAALERRVRDEGVVAPGAVEEARGYRDTLWRSAQGPLHCVLGDPGRRGTGLCRGRRRSANISRRSC